MTFFFALSVSFFALFMVAGLPLVEGQMDSGARLTVTNAHNADRSAVAQGGQVQNGNSGQTLGPASNMQQLFYDMSLEAFAQNWTNQCKGGHSRGPYGENYYGSTARQSASQVAQAATASWFAEFKQYGLPSLVYVNAKDYNVGHATQIAWGDTQLIGCGYTWWPNLKFSANFVCEYSKPGNWEGEPVYQQGPPCRQNSDCTTYPGSRCNAPAGLCIAPGTASKSG